MGGGARGNFGRTLGSGRNINNPIVNSNRIGSATKKICIIISITLLTIMLVLQKRLC